MGYISHNCIVVTGWDSDRIDKAYKKATDIFKRCPVTPVTESKINGYMSFFIGPDGSKEGWGASNDGDAERELFISWLKKTEELYLDWALIQYGNDDGITLIIDHSDNEEEKDGR